MAQRASCCTRFQDNPDAEFIDDITVEDLQKRELATRPFDRVLIDLLADDDDLVRKSVIAQITSLGYNTIEASNPAAALEIIGSKQPIDLLLSDIVMPGPIDGVELARLAGEQRLGLKGLLTSGYPDLKTSHTSEKKPWAILKKPYRRNELQRMLKDTLSSALHDGTLEGHQLAPSLI